MWWNIFHISGRKGTANILAQLKDITHNIYLQRKTLDKQEAIPSCSPEHDMTTEHGWRQLGSNCSRVTCITRRLKPVLSASFWRVCASGLLSWANCACITWKMQKVLLFVLEKLAKTALVIIIEDSHVTFHLQFWEMRCPHKRLLNTGRQAGYGWLLHWPKCWRQHNSTNQ